MTIALILAAGYGKRHRVANRNVQYLPKGLIEVQGHPVLSYTKAKLEKTDINKIIVAVNQANETFYKRYLETFVTSKDYVLVTERISTFNNPLGVGETIEKVIEEIKIKGDLLILPCDTIFDYDLQLLINFYRKLKDQDVVAVYKLNNTNALKRLAVVQMDRDNKIISYENRPKKPSSRYIPLLHLVLSERSLKALPEFLSYPHGKEHIRDFIGTRIPFGIYGFNIGKEWIDIGTPADLKRATKLRWIKKLSKSLRVQTR